MLPYTHVRQLTTVCLFKFVHLVAYSSLEKLLQVIVVANIFKFYSPWSLAVSSLFPTSLLDNLQQE